MASGAESPRQKMINLMYLVFIAMLALNMSKEVLTTFGNIENNLTKSSKNLKNLNDEALAQIRGNARTDSIIWKEPNITVDKISALANDLVLYIESDIKQPIIMKVDKNDRNENGSVEDSIPDYEIMDNSVLYDELLFKDSDTPSAVGDSLIMFIDNFRVGALDAIDNSKIGVNDEVVKRNWDERKQNIRLQIIEKFSTDSVKITKKKKNWLKYNYYQFPEIASTTKLTLLQENTHTMIASVISNVNEIILGEDLNKLTPIVKGASAFYENDKLSGGIVLGKYDQNFIAQGVEINGREYNPNEVMENGEVILEKLGINVGRAGAKKLTGTITFRRLINGKHEIFPIAIDHEYFVNPPLAIISNTDMNIVYASIPNTLKISIPGVSNDNIQILNPKSIRKGKLSGEYTMEGEVGIKGKVRIKVKDKVSGIVSPDVIFDVVPLPKPIASFSGKGSSQSRQQIASGLVKGSFNNERLDKGLSLKVASFQVRIGLRNLGVVRNTGGRFNDRVKSEILKARRGEVISITNIRFNSQKIENGTKMLPPQNDVVLTVR